ncbi:MAG: hypothetical protein F4Y02_11040 [Chloroflexi bacterium]|nr:hypothetical protein [Chloroflexota bacterium]
MRNQNLIRVGSACLLVVALVGAALASRELLGTGREEFAPNRRFEPSRIDNPNYPVRNPFYFEGKIDYELLGIDEPENAWEYLQRGIWHQDDREDLAAAKADYRHSIALNDPSTGTCRIIRSRADLEISDPPPCMFTPRLRLAYLLLHEDPDESIRLFREVLEIDPLFLEVNLLIGKAYHDIAKTTADPEGKLQAYEAAIRAFRAELELAPVASPDITPDRVNNSTVHWHLAEVYEESGQLEDAIMEFDLYLEATRWHSDVYPWRIPLAAKKIEILRSQVVQPGHGGGPDSANPQFRESAGP